MRIVQITPGSGDSFYCENCLRDAALVKAMRRLEHDILMVPLYLPLQSDKAEPLSNAPIFFGGVNVYLQQKFALFRRTPRWIDKLFDSRRLLEWAGRKAGMTSARDLGETTVSMLEGEDGRQVKELDRLVDWLQAEEQKPDVVCLSNILLGGLARRIKDRLGVPVLCLLQDEDGFLDGLTSPYAEQAWEIVRRRARDVDGFLAVTDYFGRTMQERLSVEPARMHVVHMGIELNDYTPPDTRPAEPTIGYLSRMCPQHGLDTLIEAFILLKKEPALASARLRISGGRYASDEPFIEQMRQRLRAAGVLDDVEFLDTFDRDAKPVVEPAIGSFPETIEMAGGGVLYEPNTAEKLAESLAALLSDPEAVGRLGAEGRAGVCKAFDIERTARDMVDVCERMARKGNE